MSSKIVFFRNIWYALSSNLIVLLVSILTNLIVPKLMGVREFSYWQLYVFLTSYVGIFHLGWIDGIYLNLGGKNIEEVDQQNIKSQFFYYIILNLLFSLILFVVVLVVNINYEKKIALFGSLVALIVYNGVSFLLMFFQAVNNIKEYSKVLRIDRYIYLVTLLFYLLIGGKNFIFLICIDLFSKITVFILEISRNKKIFFFGILGIREVFPEIIENIKSGSKLLISNLASSFSTGITRIVVEARWSIVVFGKLSFTLGITNMILIFINAIGIVIFPLLRNSKAKLDNLYKHSRLFFDLFVFFLIPFFYPLKIILLFWLPNYSQSIFYMGLIFPMIIYEGKIALLLSTFLNTIRKEKFIMVSNLISVFLGLSMSIYAAYRLHNLFLLVLCILVTSMCKALIMEFFLSRELKVSYLLNFIFEVFMTVLFICSNSLNNYFLMLIYMLSLVVYSIVNYNNLKFLLRFTRHKKDNII